MEEGKIVRLKDKKKLKDFGRYEENPSSGRHKIQDLAIRDKPENVKNIVVTKEQVDEIIDQYESVAWSVKVKDGKNYVKLFDGAQKDLVQLGAAGIAMFCYIMQNLRKLQDQIIINPTLFGEWYRGIEGGEKADIKMVCYRGIIDLLRNEFIYLKTGEGSYFININKFFNGDRTKLPWVAEINERLRNRLPIAKGAVDYNENYKPSK